MGSKNTSMRLLKQLILIMVLFFVLFSLNAYGKVHELRGRWDIDATDEINENHQEFTFYINEVTKDPNNPEEFFGAGCMKTNETDFIAPLSLVAKSNDNGIEIIKLLSTALINTNHENQVTSVIEFNGDVIPGGNGVKDDQSNGFFELEINGNRIQGSWAGSHHDRRITDCPEVEIPPLIFFSDLKVFIDREVNNGNVTDKYVSFGLDCLTNIVSSGVYLEMPDGRTMNLPPYTDIFTPQIDFISEFRFTQNVENEYPIIGEPYYFTLLDILGNPIPGATQTDFWSGECHNPASDVNVQLIEVTDVNGNAGTEIHMSWNYEIGPGFDPTKQADGSGDFQLYMYALEGSEGTVFGSGWIYETNHVIPWEPFESSGDEGTPDGSDFGKSLSELEDGKEYLLRISANGYPTNGISQGFECVMYNSNNNIIFKKDGSQITILSNP